MDFIALTPGVHSIDALSLTDVQSGYIIHLKSVTIYLLWTRQRLPCFRNVIDIIVHEPDYADS